MIKVFEAFAGYGSQSMALRRLGVDFGVVGISEIDKYAIQAYMAVHGDTPNYGDISKIDWNSVPDFDFLTYSFPCTDISTAGQQKGLAEGSGTRSSLLWECRKAIEAKRPKYLLMENVKNLVSKKFTPYLKEWLKFLEGQGYSNYTKVLNAKDFGIPQNRERVFMVSILGEASFHFPKPFTLDKRLKDVLEKNVDESFYLKQGIINTFIRRTIEAKQKGNGFAFILRDGNDIAAVVKCRASSQIEDNFIKEPVSCAMRGRNPDNPSDRTTGIPTEQRIEIGSNVANCITTVQKDSLIAEPKIVTYTRDKKGNVTNRRLADIANTVHASTGHGGNTDCFVAEPKIFQSPRGFNKGALFGDCPAITSSRWQDNNFLTEPQVLTPKRTEYGKALRKAYEAGKIKESRHNMTELEPRTDGISNTITTVQKDNLLMEYFTNYRIRKLTPRECFRLMGVPEDDIDKIQAAGISKTQQYKMAGNSIV